jgi:hypothetical protein
VRAWLRAPLACAAAAAAAIGLTAQEPPSADAARAAWQFRRAVTLPPAETTGRVVAVAIPPDVAEHSQRTLQDLRLVAADGREVPYVLDVDVPRETERRRTGRLVEAQQDRRDRSAWAIDFGVVAPFDRLELDIDGTGFAKRARLEISDDGVRWTPVAGEAWVFDRPWRGRQVHDTTLERPTPLVARFVRVTLDDVRSRPVVVRGATAILTGTLGGGRWTRDAALTRLETRAGAPSRYKIEAPATLPVERVTIATADTAYWREVRVFEDVPGRGLQPIAPPSPIYRLGVGDADLDVEHRDVDLARAAASGLVLEIDDGDSPPLAAPRVTLSGTTRRMLVPPVASGLTLYYGNPVTRRPVYDLEALRLRLAFAADFPTATLGPEAANPRFAPAPPLAFVAARGAAADVTRWPYARVLTIESGDDLYTVALAATDLGHLRGDLADLRLVDADGRQVPYVIEPQADAASAALQIAGATPRPGLAKTSAFALTLPGVRDVSEAPPIATLRLTFAEAFFTRPAAVTVPDARAAQGRAVVAQETLRALRRDAGAAPEPIAIALGGLRADRLVVEISDGDNAPLTPKTAEAVVLVPRVTFKAAKGTYRLLAGNPDAEAPTYDLAALRQDVLAYSALPLDGAALGPLAPNPAYARGAGDVARSLSNGPVLWGVLGLSIAVLLWLTWRILKQPAS